MKNRRKRVRKFFKKNLPGISLERDPNFIRNILIVLGVILVRRGGWNILDTYMLPEQPLLSNLLSVFLGIAILYLPDRSLDELGGSRGSWSQKKHNHTEKEDTEKR